MTSTTLQNPAKPADIQAPSGSTKEPACLFCNRSTLDVVYENSTAFTIFDTSPVTGDHMLIIPKRHSNDFFSLTGQELRDCHQLILELREKALEKDPSIAGFNIGVNCGQAAGQTVFHAHIHFIPRRNDDTPNPRGGVRGVIPDKMNY